MCSLACREKKPSVKLFKRISQAHNPARGPILSTELHSRSCREKRTQEQAENTEPSVGGVIGLEESQETYGGHRWSSWWHACVWTGVSE